MKFHNTHGVAVKLTDGKTVATRSETSFCHGVVFGGQPIKVNEKVCLQLTTSSLWSGALRVGVTQNDPGKLKLQELPKYAFPNLAVKEGYWICPISEKFINAGSKVTLYISLSGQLQFFVDGVYKGACLTGIPKDRPLWLCMDLYGNTKAAKFIKPDDAPKEILARGPNAVQAYEEACTSGTRPVYRTRLMLVGQDGVGKTSLKKALTGQRHDKNEESTDGIDLSASCSFNMTNRDQWRMNIRGEEEKEADNEEEQKKLGIMGGAPGLEEEYHQALAENIVKELSQMKNKNEKSAVALRGRTPSRDSTKSMSRRQSERESLRSGSSVHRTISNASEKLGHIPSDMLNEVPERVVQLVQEMLDQSPEPVATPNQRVRSQTRKVSVSRSVDDNKMSASKADDRTNVSKSVDDTTSKPVEIQTNKQVVLNIWDFSGQAVYYTTHQVFLTSRAVYVIVFNMCHNLHKQRCEVSNDDQLCTLDYMDFWMRSVFAHASQNSTSTVENTRLSPPIFIIGTHRNSLSSDPEEQNQMVESKFEEIRNFLLDKPYTQHVVTPFIAVENNLEDQEDGQIEKLRQKIEEVASKEPYIGEQMPIKWLKFEREITDLAEEGTNHASFDQIREIASTLGITNEKEVITMLEFYHDLGILVYYGSTGTLDNLLRNTVVLKPKWLIDMFKRIILAKETEDKWSLMKDKWRLLEEKGILEDSLIDYLWKDTLTQKLVLLGLMEKFDLLCSRLQTNDDHLSKSYFVPSRLTREHNENKKLYADNEHNVVFYIDFNGFLPEGLFHKIQTRTVKWCLDTTGKEPYSLLSHVARYYLDPEHDFVLEMAPRKCHRVKVVVLRVIRTDDSSSVDSETDSVNDPSPKPKVCAKLRNFLESSLLELKNSWMKRISYNMCVECSCARPCYLHGDGACQEEACIHFLDLDECLANRIVCCEHRRVNTSNVKKWFPEPQSPGFHGQVLPTIDLGESYGNIEKHNKELPTWVKGAAKLLNAGESNQDWQALSKLMGYKEKQIERFLDDVNPGLALLADWILSSGNTVLSVDMLIGFLEKLDREDIIEIIQKAKDTEKDPPQVFISYQWDCQDDVKRLRDHLEKCGFTCWMDVGQMGGGDQLNAKIDTGVRKSKVLLACVTPKYVVSHHCNRELSLADLLNKPIIPIMFEEVAWPPLGGMSLIFSQLVYIDMKGVGGHGGTGIHADLKDKYKEIVQKLMSYAVPDLTKYFDTDTLSSKQFSHYNDDLSMSSDDTTVNIHHPSQPGMIQQPSIPVTAVPQQIMQQEHRHPQRPPHRPQSQQQQPHSQQPPQVQVSQCGVCVIL